MTRKILSRPITLAVLALASSLTPSSLTAQATAPVFDRLAGEWQGEGTLMGRNAEFAMTWKVHGELATLVFTNGFSDSTGALTPVLEAVAAYRTVRETPEAVWLDSRGVRIEIDWQAPDDSTLVADWSAPSESGRATYRVVGSEVVEVTDEVRSDDGWRTFATARYGRLPAP